MMHIIAGNIEAGTLLIIVKDFDEEILSEEEGHNPTTGNTTKMVTKRNINSTGPLDTPPEIASIIYPYKTQIHSKQSTNSPKLISEDSSAGSWTPLNKFSPAPTHQEHKRSQ